MRTSFDGSGKVVEGMLEKFEKKFETEPKLRITEEFYRSDLVSSMKDMTFEELKSHRTLKIADKCKSFWEKPVQVSKNTDVACDTSYEIDESFAYKSKLKDNHGNCVEYIGYNDAASSLPMLYDLDEIDLKWLDIVQRENIISSIDEEVLEGVITDFEINTLREQIARRRTCSESSDDNAFCDICLRPDFTSNDLIVFCDSCDCKVHQKCYGIMEVPEGPWFCKVCELNLKPKCIMCKKTHGPMKKVKSKNEWVHVICALWIYEIVIEDAINIEDINISEIPKSRSKLVCSFCDIAGGCIQCQHKSCKTAFHITCAIQNKLEIEKETKNNVTLLKIFCQDHKNTSTDAYYASVLDLTKCLSEEEIREHVHFEKTAVKFKLDNHIVERIYEFWLRKRKYLNANSLISKEAFLRYREGDFTIDDYENIILGFNKYRLELEELRNILFVLIKREETKRDMYKKDVEIIKKTT